jgi:P-type Ca2+ transporter type 2C
VLQVLVGLTQTEADQRLAADGPNVLPQTARRSGLRIVGEVLREPMLALLLGGGFAYLLLGDNVEALILLAFATFSVAVTVIQETRTEHVLEALRDLSAPRALVMRDGARIRIAGRDVVRGDLLVLEQGDRVAADATLIEARDLKVDESLLTGESVPVHKRAADDTMTPESHRPGGEDQPYIYSGSMIARGSGLARVTSTGQYTEIGKIGTSLNLLEPEAPRLRTETTRIVRLCAIGGAMVALLVVLLFGLTRGGWIDAILAGIATGMSMLPEEFPVVLTIFLAMGAWRIGKAGVLTRRAAAIETLGSTTILCTDKTGTLTENRMAVVRLWHPEHDFAAIDLRQPVPDQFAPILEVSLLASAVNAVDPMEIAIHEAGKDSSDKFKEWELTHSYGLRPDLLAMSNRWKVAVVPESFVIAAKGAPEAIAQLCNMSAVAKEKLLSAVDEMAKDGIRVLGVARAETGEPKHAEVHRDYAFKLVGLIGLADPLRPSAAPAVAECQNAGIRVAMITGDYAATAHAIASHAGIADGDVLTGSALDALGDRDLAKRLQHTSVFARIMPEQKLRIVEAFKANGEIVAMTGDGVNDAPSLKAAHIGIAMGKRGTDVAREASSIVLLDDDFGSIVKTIALGRQIYDNIRKAMAFIFAVHVPIAGLALLPLFLGTPILFGPIHIALLEMVIDPVCALVFEAERPEPDIMRRPPRDPKERLFSWNMIIWSVFQGLVAFGLLATLYVGGWQLGMEEADLRGLVFFALVAQIFVLVLINRSFSASLAQALGHTNRALLGVLASVGAVVALVLLFAPVRAFLKFGIPHNHDFAIVAGTGVALLIGLELLKPVAHRLSQTRTAP